jgi:hypothetical protein
VAGGLRECIPEERKSWTLLDGERREEMQVGRGGDKIS